MMGGNILVSTKIKIFFTAATMSLIGSPVFAEEKPLSEDKRGAISQYCETTRQTLKNLQKSDARIRTNIGSTYEVLQSRFMIPFNTRLINNNFSIAELSTVQSDFVTLKNTFHNDFTSYSQALDDLIAADCKNNPDGFYKQLITVRDKRKIIHDEVSNLNTLARKYHADVMKFGEKL